MAQKSADHAANNGRGSIFELVRRKKVAHDVVVVASVEGDVVAATFGYGANDGECAVAIKGGDFDGAHIWDVAEVTPEFIGEFDAADGGLQVEAKNVDDAGNRPAVIEERADRCAAKCGEVDQAEGIAEVASLFGFAHGLPGVAADAGDADERVGAIGVGAVHFFGGDFEHRSEQTDRRIVDGELRGVDADGEAACAGSDVVTRESALAAFSELAL